MSAPIHLADILRAPYVRAGRSVTKGIDCLGVVIEIAQRMGLDAPDPWASIHSAWRNGTLEASSGFPPSWHRVHGFDLISTLRSGDVLLWFEHHPWAAIVCDGNVWSADLEVGVYCKPLNRWTKQPTEVWRCSMSS